MFAQHDVMMAVNFISMYFWSQLGSEFAGLPIFVEDEKTNVDYRKGVAWMSLRSEAVDVLRDIATFFLNYIDPLLRFKELMCPVGENLE